MIGKTVLQLNPTPRYQRLSEGAFVTLKDGRILFAYARFDKSPSDFGSAVIASRVSNDAGRTWSTTDRVLVQNEGDVNVMSPTLLRLSDGRLALFYLRKDLTGAQDSCYCRLWMRVSQDDGKRFEDPRCVTPLPAYMGINNDRVVQLSTGRLLAPMAYHPYRLGTQIPPGMNSVPVSYQPAAMMTCFFSDDQGTTWMESLNPQHVIFRNGRGLQEPGVIERKDGSVMMWARSGLPRDGKPSRQWHASSSDHGLTWTAFKPGPFVSPCSPMSVRRLADGRWLALWNDRSDQWNLPQPGPNSKNRTPLASAWSLDEGVTWQGHRLIESDPDHGFCYTAIHEVGSALLLSYSCGGGASSRPLQALRIRRVALRQLLE
jgi:sialidase-1